MQLRNYFIGTRKGILLLLLFFTFNGLVGQAQNLNNPNKSGPLGTQVNTLSGNLFVPRTDIYIPARGFDMNISFSYNSFLFTEDYGYGKGWLFNYHIKYGLDTIPGARLILWGDGREDQYDSLPGGLYKSPKGFFNKLSQYQPGKYVLEELDGVKHFFDNPVHKRVTRKEEPNGNFINFTYTDSLLTSISNNAGQTISFTYNEKGRLATVVDALQTPTRTYQYNYDGVGNLKEIVDPLNGKYQYTYLINGPMKSLADKNNNKVDIIYYPDLSIREVIGCNKRISFSYDTISKITVVTDHLGAGNQVTKFTYATLDNLSWITSISGNCCGFNMKYEYDNQGNQIKMIDANGQVYTYTYDSSGNILTTIDPLGSVSSYTYSSDFKKLNSYKDPNGNLYSISYDIKGNLTEIVTPGNNIYSATYNNNGDIVSSTDPKGNKYVYNYDAIGNPTNVTGPNGYNATLTYDARGRLVSFADARGNSSTAEYDILNRLKKITDPFSNDVDFNYDAAGNLIAFTNENNETDTYNYDASNRMVRSRGRTGNTLHYSYDEMDNLKSIQNQLGHITKLGYDDRNRLIEVKNAENDISTIENDNNGNVTRITSPNGRVVNYTYDKLNRLISVTDNTSTIASFTYDRNNNVTSYTNATGAIVSAVYDNLNRAKQVTDPLGNHSFFTYDKNNNISSITDREGNISYYTYDSLDRIKTYTDNNGFLITVGYDVQSNVVSLTDQNSNVTNYTYDNMNRRKRMIYQDGKFLENSYDEKSNLISIRLTDGSNITYSYDSLDRVISRNLPSGEVFSFTYDKLDRVITATNSNGTISFTYDVINRVTSETFDGRTVEYNYDLAGRKQTTTYPDGSEVLKEFDTRNRLIKISKNGNVIVEYAYNDANQITQKLFANGVNTIMQYDFANRLSAITTGNFQQSVFSYDKEMNKTAIQRLHNPALSELFTYDDGYRLTNYKRGPQGSPLIQNTYTYDPVGNRLSANLNGTATSYSINNLNQLTAVNGSSYSFDNRGNLVFDGIFFKSYDAENRLLKDSSSPTNVISYSYDAMNRRIMKSINGSSLKYTYSGVAPIEERDMNNNILNSTIFNSFLSPVLNENNGDKFYFHPNDMYSVEAISNSSGRLVESYQYDAYGKLARFDSLNNSLSSTITGNRVGFTGQEYDNESGTYKFFFRQYSPQTGTFHQRDLIEYEDGMGLYQYVGNNPANGVDVWGLADCPPGWIEKSKSREFNITEKGILTTWDKFSDSKVAAELVDAKLPDKIGGPINVLTLPIDGYKTIKSAQMSNSREFGSTEHLMHTGDFIKNGTNTILGGVTLGAMATGPAGAPVAAGAATISTTIWAIDKGSEAAFAHSETAWWEYNAKKSELDMKEDYINQGKTPEERKYREAKWLNNIRKREENRRLYEIRKNCVKEGGSKQKRPKSGGEEEEMGINTPFDPNEILGPTGVPDKAWVSVNDRLPYTVLFENDSSATARARFVRITSPIEPKQDANTLELGSVGFNNESFTIPPGRSSYYQRLDARDSTGVFVDLTAGYDLVNNQIFWEFQAIDPLTLLPPEDPLAGFLFLHDESQPAYGNGFVNFTIKPRQNAQTLDTIGARASIIFDENEAIATNIHTNTIDALPPVSSMNPVTGTDYNNVSLSWTGVDDNNGSGIDYYTIYVSSDQINYSILIPETRRTDTIISLPPDTLYCFFVLATDRVGNAETLRQGEITCAAFQGPLPVTWLYFNGTNQDKNNLLKWATASEQNSKEFRLERSLDGSNFNQIAVVPAAGNSTTTKQYSFLDREINKLGSEVMFYRLKQIDISNTFQYSNIVKLFYRENGKIPTVAYPNPTSGIVSVLLGDKKLIGTEAVLTDINGRILQRFKFTAINQTVNLSAYVNGVYFIRLSNKETLKLIKQ